MVTGQLYIHTDGLKEATW